MKKLMSAEEAVGRIKDGDTVWVVCSGGRINEPAYVLQKLENRFLETGVPRNLTLCHSSGIGDRMGGGSDRFAHEGMVKRVIGSHWSWSQRICQMALDNQIEAYTLPQGVMVQLSRMIAGGKPGLISHVGLGTYVDPRIEGGKMNQVCKEDIVQVIELDGKEWLYYKSFPINVTIIRGTTADEDGNITMENEGIVLEHISAAQAAKNSGGIVIAQVKRIAQRGTLDPRMVKIPGILVDAVVVDPDQRQSMKTDFNPAFTGEIRQPIGEIEKMPLDERKIVARRAALELFPGAVVNLGFGIPDGVANIAGEEGISDDIILTVEQGVIGGVPALGDDFSLATNPQAIVDEAYQFDFYDGGGLDLTFLSFAELDFNGDVNVSKFGKRVTGVGGFINISQNAKKVVFCATFTSSGLAVKVENHQIQIAQEGKYRKFVPKVKQISFSGKYALEQGKQVMYITERAVFELTKEGVMLTEIAPGIDLEQDVLEKMNFRPLISKNLKLMDARIFSDETLGLKKSFEETI